MSRQPYYIPMPRRVRSPEHHWHLGAAVVILAILGLILVGVVSCNRFEYGTEHLVTFTIASKDDQASGNNHKYLIFTRGGHTFEDTDAYFHGKLNSSDIYAGLQVGHTYTCDVYGWRNHVLSSYQNIIWCAGVAGAPAHVPGTPVQQ
jgi:hypothetical protein